MNGFHASNDVTTDACGLGGIHVTQTPRQCVDPATTAQHRHPGTSSSSFLSPPASLEVSMNGFHASNDVTTDANGLRGTQIVDPGTTTQRRHQGPSSSSFLSSRTDISVVPIPFRVHGGIKERDPRFQRLHDPNATTMPRSRHHHPTTQHRHPGTSSSSFPRLHNRSMWFRWEACRFQRLHNRSLCPRGETCHPNRRSRHHC
jgi:hypothetical protein